MMLHITTGQKTTRPLIRHIRSAFFIILMGSSKNLKYKIVFRAALTSLLALLPLTLLPALETEQAQWSAVMAGETLCAPILHGAYLYTVTSDQALNCIDGSGSFLWRRHLKRTRRPLLAASQEGILLVADAAGLVQAVSSQGLYLWSARVAKAAVYAPYCTSGSRICVLTQSRLYCFSVRGKLKWELPLPSPPAMQLRETGSGSLLLPLKNRELLTISFTGMLEHKKKIQQPITALAAAPNGYIISTKDGTLAYYQKKVQSAQKTEKPTVQQKQRSGIDGSQQLGKSAAQTRPHPRKKSGKDNTKKDRQNKASVQKTAGKLDALSIEQKQTILVGAIAGIGVSEADNDDYHTAVWCTKEKPPLFMQSEGNELICIYADGTVSVRTIADNTIMWTAVLKSRMTQPVYCAKVDGEYYLTCQGTAAILTSTGSVKRQEKLQKAAFLPLITRQGILIAVDEWVINSWKLDTKIMQQRVQEPNTALLQNLTAAMMSQAASDNPMATEKPQMLPFFIPDGDTAALLESIGNAIRKGDTGIREAEYARTLYMILTNAHQAHYFPYTFTVDEQVKAAELIGLLESLEYRTSLLEAAGATSDPTLAVAIIRALGAIASDPDGMSIKAIMLLLRRCGVREITPAHAACDALIEIAKYGDKHITDTAVQALFAIASKAFNETTRQYARQKIKTIVE